MSPYETPNPLHFEIPATFVGGHTTCLVVAFDIVDGELRFESPDMAAFAAPKAAPFEVHVKGRINRRSGGTYGFADPDGKLARALGLEPVRASADALKGWRRRLAVSPFLLIFAGAAHTLIGLWLFPRLWAAHAAIDKPDTPGLLMWLVFSALFPLFAVAMTFSFPRSVGYVRRGALFCAFSTVFFIFGSLLAGVIPGVVSIITPALALVAWYWLLPVPMLGEIPVGS